MNPDNVFSVNAEDVPARNADDSLKRSLESFNEEKILSQKKKTGNDTTELPAPFYDELLCEL